MILGLTGNRHKPQLPVVLPAFMDWLDEKGVEYVLSSDFEHIPALEGCETVPPEKVSERADVILSFGGDGTLLNTIKEMGGRETPVLGVNLGGLGYLTEVGSGELYARTEQLIEGRWQIERRLVLEVTSSNSRCEGHWYGLNDVVVDKAGYARLIQLRVSVDDIFLNTFNADGVVVSTPTGSTGYSLSAGGPIVEPNMDGILINPLNPHSLSNRPLLIKHDRTVSIEAHTPADHVSIAVDGETVCQLESGDTLVVKKADFNACLVNFAGRYFYDVLRQKLGWGELRIGR